MNCAEVSDLEEGEILEYDSVSSNYSRSDLGVRNWSLESSLKENKNGSLQLKENKRLFLSEQRKDGYVNTKLKAKLNLRERQEESKSVISITDLESISSEGEYKSDEEDVKYLPCESENYTCTNGEIIKRKKHSSHFYGTVEDIMSEIGETICRKSHSNYKTRKSKEAKQNLEKCSNSSYNLWRREVFSSHVKSKKRKRKEIICDSDSDLGKYRSEKRKKRKKRDAHYEEEEEEEEVEEITAKKIKLRDFDEMRRSLLEKLKKQKAAEELKESANETPLELENSEIQEIDMLIDCTNYVDNPAFAPQDSANEERGLEEKDGEDELDLIKLRLIALASNKKRKVEEESSNTEKPENSSVEKSKFDHEETDLDRNELLLRAEALKTALLKKHQRRLNRLKVGKPSEMGSSSINDVENSMTCPAAAAAAAAEGVVNRSDLEKENAKLDADACKENVERENEGGTNDSSKIHADPHLGMERNKTNTAALLPNVNSMKTHSRAKTKRKKKKSISFASNLKENNEDALEEDGKKFGRRKSEALEEDVSTLRTQLLSDLMKKKSLKDQEKKSVLLDSIQTAANKPSPSAAKTNSAKVTGKPLPATKKTLLKKINPPKTTKPVPVANIPKPEIQRIIVHLGSEDSSDDDVDADAPKPRDAENKGSAVADSEAQDARREAGEGIQAKYERSVELLLSQARKKIEGEKQTAASTISTPEAVYKHLPPSQRLEYIRLKQKIAEREKLRKQKKENPNNSISTSSDPHPVLTSVLTSTGNEEESPKRVPPEPNCGVASKPDSATLNSSTDNGSSLEAASSASKAEVARHSPSDSKNPEGQNSGKTKASRRLVVNKMRSQLTDSLGKGLNSGAAPSENDPKTAALTQRNLLLLPSSQGLISKLKLMLKKIKIEKMIEENYEREISKLKNQLGLFEKKKSEQRFKIKKLWEESMKTYKAIPGIAAKTKEKAVPKEKARQSDLASTGEGKKPEIATTPEVGGAEGKKVSSEPETKISKAESDKEVKNDDKKSESVTEGVSSCPHPVKYDSPLQVFSKVADLSTRVDPNVTVCQFDLMGVCKDEECTYQHLRILAK